MRAYRGSCHCGKTVFSFETAKPLEPRACQCSFCRKVSIRAADSSGYRFGTRVAEYLVCGDCGVYVGAIARIEDSLYATLNLNAFDEPHPHLSGVPVSYDGESSEAKSQRRLERWTPATAQWGAEDAALS